MGKFDGWMLVSDFDGTLIGEHGVVPPQNIEAIQRFVAEGGRFVGATGRTECNVRPFMDGLPVNTPWILYNGGAIYDFCWGSFVWRALLDREKAEPFAAAMIRRFPELNVQVHCGGPYYETNPADPVDLEVVHEHQEYLLKPLAETPDGWIKVLFGCADPAVLQQVQAAYRADPLFLVSHNMYSGARYYEITPPNVSKGTAVKRLQAMLNPVPHTVVAIGDYGNDLEMLQMADISAAPVSATPEVRAVAKIQVCHHADGAVADLVDRLFAGAY